MNSFLRRTFLFLFFPLLFGILCELNISLFKDDIFHESELAEIFYPLSSRYKWVDKFDTEEKVYLTGSSSIKYGLSCNALHELSDKKFVFLNLADDARGAIETYFILKNIDLKEVKHIYLGVEPWFFSKRYYYHRDIYFYLNFNFWEAFTFFIMQDKFIFMRRYIAFARYLFPLFNRMVYSQTPKTEVPYNNGSVILTKPPSNFDVTSEDIFDIDKYGWSDIDFDYFKKIDLLAKAHNIEFTFVVTPKRSDFTSLYKSSFKQCHNQFVKELLNHGFNGSIIGRFDLFEEYPSDSMFIDAFHLNKCGFNAFTTRFWTLMNSNNNNNSTINDYVWFTDIDDKIENLAD